jgi:hypothetical protein
MVKHSRNKRHHRKSHRKYSRKMYGGAFSDADRNELIQLGFTPDQIEALLENDSNIILVRMALQQINPDTGNVFTPQELIDSMHEDMNISGISMNSNHDLEYNDELDGNNMSNDSMHLSELNQTIGSDNNTTTESFGSLGGKRRKTKKSRKTRKIRKNKRNKSRNQRGGQCYGRGIGANNYDPNFSIYNTNELQLFPYKPTN